MRGGVRRLDGELKAPIAAVVYLQFEPPGPMVALNRAIALAMADTPQAGLNELETLASDPQFAHSTVRTILPIVRLHSGSQ